MTQPVLIPPRGQIINGIQILRGIAAMLVVCRHSAKYLVPGNAEGAFEVGQVGVDIFFVISGIVIYLTGRRLRWDVFVRRRLARIVPLYWIVLAIKVATMAVLPQPHDEDAYRVANVVASFLFVPAHQTAGTIFPTVIAGWTLNFEMYFYLVCALVLGGAPRRFLGLVTAVIIGAAVVGVPLLRPPAALPQFAPLVLLLPISLEFLAGMWFAHHWTEGGRAPAWLAGALIATAVAAIALVPVSQPYTFWRFVYWGIPAAAIGWAVLSLEERLPFDRWGALLLLGNASYAIYITHTIVLRFAPAALDRGPKVPAVLALLVLVSACATLGIAMHLIVERRVVKIASRLLRLQPPTPGAKRIQVR